MILGGPRVRPDLDVIDFRAYSGIEIVAPLGAKPRHKAITQIVVHTTGGEGDVDQLHRVLTRRRVGVDFFVDRKGVIWQLSDPLEQATYHGGRYVNSRSVGIEVACYLFRWPARAQWSWRDTPSIARDREVYEARVAGRRYFFADLYPAQKQAVAGLVDTLLEELPDVERAVPLEADGTLRTRRFSKAEVRAYSGVLGHLHIPGSSKLDPGTRILRALRNRFTQ